MPVRFEYKIIKLDLVKIVCSKDYQTFVLNLQLLQMLQNKLQKETNATCVKYLLPAKIIGPLMQNVPK